MKDWASPAVVILTALLADPALAQASRYTELVGPSCRFIPGDPRPGDVKRCKGLGGASPETLAEHTRTRFGMRFGPAPGSPLLTAWSLGTRLEWRGASGSGRFVPEAAILRVLLKDPESPKPTPDGQVLAVLRVDAPRRQACVAAVLDASQPQANARAREAADRVGASFVCGAARPSTVGDTTPWTKRVLETLP